MHVVQGSKLEHSMGLPLKAATRVTEGLREGSVRLIEKRF